MEAKSQVSPFKTKYGGQLQQAGSKKLHVSVFRPKYMSSWQSCGLEAKVTGFCFQSRYIGVSPWVAWKQKLRFPV